MRTKSLFAALLCLAFSAPIASAQSLIIIERDRVRPRPMPIPRPRLQPSTIQPVLKSQKVDVKIDDQLAVTTVTQEFFNPLNRQVEGKYIFPIPSGATISQFSMWMNGKEVQGELLDSKKARDVYEGIVRRMRDPALLEFMGQGVFQARIFPIAPHSTQKVKLTYSQAIRVTRQRCAYQFALNAAKLNRTESAPLTISMSIKSSSSLAGIFSPSHDVVIARKGENAALVSYETNNAKNLALFQLHYDLVKSDIGLTARSYQVGNQDGYVMLTLTPNPKVQQKELPAKAVVFVLDTSGSMAGDDMKGLRLKQAQKALKSCINYLQAKDKFNIVAFSMEAREFKSTLVDASAANKAEAFEFIDSQQPRGATALDEALTKTLKMQPEDSSLPFTVVVISDGKPTFGETNEKRILKNVKANLKNARVFSFGIGSEVNSRLLDSIAVQSRGDREYVLDDEEIEFKISSFYDKFAFPVLSDCKLTFDGIEVFDYYPRSLPDLFKGQSLTVFGRYKKGGANKIKLSGRVGDKDYSKDFECEFAKDNRELKFLPTLWASRKISVLLEQIRINGEHKELREEVVRLARKYGIPTPYTSYLVVEDSELEPVNAPGGVRRGRWGRRRLGGRPEEAQRQSGEKGGASDMANSAPAPKADGTGRGNVEESLALKKLKEGKIQKELNDDSGQIRRIGSKTFYLRKGVWTDSELKDDAKTSKKIEALSDDYFKFVAENPECREILSLGQRVKFMLKSEVIEIVLPATK